MSSRLWSSSSNLERRGFSAPATEAVLGELEVAGAVTGGVAGAVTEEIAEASTGAHADPAHAEDPDRDIVHLIHIGAPNAALRSLMRRHGDAVYRYCRGALREAALADDVHQQIFIEAARDLARFAGRGALRTWLFAIARHRVLDAVKAHRRARVHLEDRDTADAPDPNPPTWERLDDARLYEALAACCGEPRRAPAQRGAAALSAGVHVRGHGRGLRREAGHPAGARGARATEAPRVHRGPDRRATMTDPITRVELR